MAYDQAVFGMGTVIQPASHGIGHVNEMHICPYDESHVMFGEKYLTHLAKCRLRKEGKTVAEDGSSIQICPYNPRHHFHHSVIDKHIQMCDGYYKYQMDKQPDPLSMQETFRRYEMVVPVTNPNPNQDYEDDSSLYGDVDGDAPIEGITMIDSHGRMVFPKTRNEFRKIQTKVAEKLVRRKLKQMRVKKRDSSPDPDFSRVSTSYGDGHRSFSSLSEISYVEKMKNVADFADSARVQLLQN